MMHEPYYALGAARLAYWRASAKLAEMRTKPFYETVKAQYEAKVLEALDMMHKAQSDLTLHLAHTMFDHTALEAVLHGSVVLCRRSYLENERKRAAQYGAWAEYSKTRTHGRMPKRFAQFGDRTP
jgi:hypothetical protein